MADYLKIRGDGAVAYESTQTGSFDLYVPFIEQGLRLLNERGRLGFICPSLWEMNDYGAGLRRLIERGRNLEGWINFRAFQVFDEVITYCALQFFSKRANETVKIALAGNGEVSENPWPDENCELPYEQIGFGDRWLLLTGDERDLIDKLTHNCEALGSTGISTGIYQGLITSADPIFHLNRLGPNQYKCLPAGQDAYPVEIEDDIMHPLVSGEHAKRYTLPETDKYVLFPYERTDQGMRLISQANMANLYPKAWKHLQGYETALRNRESNKHDDDQWYRFGRNQNLDKQEVKKLIVAQTVPNLRVCFDVEGKFYINNVRVNGISADNEKQLWFLMAVLNSRIANFVFKRIAKIKVNNFYEANKQFVAPLPIPIATDDKKNSVAAQAEVLQDLTTTRRDLANRIAKRTGSLKLH